MKFFLAVALVPLIGYAHAQSVPITAAQVPLRGVTPQSMVPRGWKLEKRINGDLNRDKKADAALVLVENGLNRDAGDNPAARKRALVVILKEGTGYRRAGFNSSLLLGTRDGGAFYGGVETPVNISIKSGVLLINQDSGSREVTETTHKFRFDARKNRFLLIGLEQTDRDRATGAVKQISANFLTGKQQTTRFNIENNRKTVKTARVSRKLRSLESVKVEERYSA